MQRVNLLTCDVFHKCATCDTSQSLLAMLLQQEKEGNLVNDKPNIQTQIQAQARGEDPQQGSALERPGLVNNNSNINTSTSKRQQGGQQGDRNKESVNTVDSVGNDSESKPISASIHAAAATGMANNEHKMVRARTHMSKDGILRVQHGHNATMVANQIDPSLISNIFAIPQIRLILMQLYILLNHMFMIVFY